MGFSNSPRSSTSADGVSDFWGLESILAVGTSLVVLLVGFPSWVEKRRVWVRVGMERGTRAGLNGGRWSRQGLWLGYGRKKPKETEGSAIPTLSDGRSFGIRWFRGKILVFRFRVDIVDPITKWVGLGWAGLGWAEFYYSLNPSN